MDETTEELMRRTQNGDVEAFGALYDRLAGNVYGVCIRTVDNATLAEEICQATFLEVWQRAPRFNLRSRAVDGWVAMIAHRRAAECAESNGAGRAGDDFIHRDPSLDRVDRALLTLTGPQQQAISLAYYGGLTYREVAETLQVAPESVNSGIRDGLVRLGTLLGPPTTPTSN